MAGAFINKKSVLFVVQNNLIPSVGSQQPLRKVQKQRNPNILGAFVFKLSGNKT